MSAPATTKRPHALTIDSMAESFFYQHAGWSYTPGKETKRQGRIRGAKALAHAEAYGKGVGYRFQWTDSPEAWDGDSEAPRYLLDCILFNEQGDVLGCLGMIGLNDLDDPYCRVVEAELALEAMPDFGMGAEVQA